MGNPPFCLTTSKPTKIAFFRALKLGDLLCATPALRAIKNALPNTSITLLGLPTAEEFAQRFPHLFSGFISFPGWPGLPEQPFNSSAVPPFLQRLQEERFDLFIQCHGSGSHVNDLALLSGATRIAGFHESEHWIPDPETFLRYPDQDPEVWRCLRLVTHLGASVDSEQLEFPLYDRDFMELESALPEGTLQTPYVVLHVGALANRHNMWPMDHFASVARGLQLRGFTIVLTGSEYEEDLVRDLSNKVGDSAINLCGKTSLGSLGALLSRARLLICHDTGVSHLAAALRVPSVIIFDRSEREGWPPSNRKLHRFLTKFGAITPQEVLRETEDLIRSTELRGYGGSTFHSPPQFHLTREII